MSKTVSVRVSTDAMKAYITVSPQNNEKITEKILENTLLHNNVAYLK